MSENRADNLGYLYSGALAVTTPVQPVPATAVPVQADCDETLIRLWLHGRPAHTRRAYERDVRRFQAFVGKPLHQARLMDVQGFCDDLANSGLSPASRNRTVAAVKSLFGFALKIGFLVFDPCKPIRLQAVRDTLSERILPEGDVQRMIALESHPRNHAMLLVLYASGVRVSEICGLRWRDCQPREKGGQISVQGKRGKCRTILLPQSVMTVLMGLRQDSVTDDGPVFPSRRRRALSSQQVLKIVKRAAKRAKINRNVVVHSFRHCHCSHALDRGAPLSLVRDTVGHENIQTTSRYCHARPADSSGNYLPL